MLTLLTMAAMAQDAPPAAVLAQSEASTEERTVPLRLSLVPGVGLGADPNANVDGASMGMIAHAASLEGVDAEFVYSWVDGDVDGVQASLGGNVAGDLDGLQLSVGANWARGDVHVGQVTVGANLAEADVRGLQAATGLNVAGGTVYGVQASSGLNVASGLDGVQAGMLNVGGAVKGLQLGLVNVGRDVDGVQLGLVNIARTSKVSIAPVNIIGDGLHRVDVWTSESAVASAALKLGSKNVYTLAGVGWTNPSQPWWTFGGGFGLHLGRDPLWLEIDDSVWGLASGNVIAPGVHNKLRAQVGIDIVDHFAPFVGVSMNTWVGTGEVWPHPIGIPARFAEHKQIVTWPGVHAGVSF